MVSRFLAPVQILTTNFGSENLIGYRHLIFSTFPDFSVLNAYSLFPVSIETLIHLLGGLGL